MVKINVACFELVDWLFLDNCVFTLTLQNLRSEVLECEICTKKKRNVRDNQSCVAYTDELY